MKSLQILSMSLLNLGTSFLYSAIVIAAIIAVLLFVKKNKEYKSSSYYQITRLPYLSVRRDIGRYGEYLTYKYLREFESKGAKFLFNIYIPKENGETAEIDVLMLCSKGLFVFESKNYSGWIFGSENQKNWYQTLPAGRGRSHKEHFYNPIMQNRSHIKHLKAFLNEQIPMHSIITFSDRCTLKSVQTKSDDVSVINRYNVFAIVSEICNHIPDTLLSETQINELYNKLYPYTQVDGTVKAQHIENINSSLQSKAKAALPQPSQPLQSPEPIISQSAENIDDDTAIAQNEIPPQNDDIIEMPVTDSNTQAENSSQPLKCPKCGANLVLRTATRGANAGNQFYGCSNYPKCRYVKNIKKQ